jgi:hypothetical protein
VITSDFLPTVNEFVTEVAAGYVPFPDCAATNVQVPTEMAVIVRVETVHTDVVLDVTVTVKPLVAETVTVNESPYVLFEIAAKLMMFVSALVVNEVAELSEESV